MANKDELLKQLGSPIKEVQHKDKRVIFHDPDQIEAAANALDRQNAKRRNRKKLTFIRCAYRSGD